MSQASIIQNHPVCVTRHFQLTPQLLLQKPGHILPFHSSSPCAPQRKKIKNHLRAVPAKRRPAAQGVTGDPGRGGRSGWGVTEQPCCTCFISGLMAGTGRDSESSAHHTGRRHCSSTVGRFGAKILIFSLM